MVDFLKYFVSVLVSVPGHPSHGPFYLIEALLKVVKAWSWEAKSTGKVLVYTSILGLLAANYQKQLPFRWENVDSNDMLWGTTKKHLTDIVVLINRIIKEIEVELEIMSQSQAVTKSDQALAIIDFLYTSIICAEHTPEFVQFVVQFVRRINNLEQGTKHLPGLVDYTKSVKAASPTLIAVLQEESQIKIKW